MDKKYLSCTVTRFDRTTFQNPLKLSEAHLISQLAQQNFEVTVVLMHCSKDYYKSLFG